MKPPGANQQLWNQHICVQQWANITHLAQSYANATSLTVEMNEHYILLSCWITTHLTAFCIFLDLFCCIIIMINILESNRWRQWSSARWSPVPRSAPTNANCVSTLIQSQLTGSLTVTLAPILCMMKSSAFIISLSLLPNAKKGGRRKGSLVASIGSRRAQHDDFQSTD